MALAYVLCEVHKGVSTWDASVAVRDVHNVRTFLNVPRNFLKEQEGKHYLPIGTVHRVPEKGVVLIEFPEEADSGAWRIWVPLTSLLEPNEAVR